MLTKFSHAACIRVAAIFLAVLATSAVFAAESKVLNIGWTGGSAWTALPDRIAAERGFFEKEGLRVRYIQFQGTNLMLSALLANELDYVTILPFIAGAATRGLPVKIVGVTTKASGYAIISRPEIDSVKALKGKRIAINTFGSSADFAIYQLLSRNGLDPNKDVTLQAIAGSPDARFAALRRRFGRCHRRQQPIRISRRAERLQDALIGQGDGGIRQHTHRRPEHDRSAKSTKSRMRSCAFCAANARPILFLQSQREIGVGLLEKLLKLDRAAAERFYPVYRDQYNPELTLPDSVVEEWIAVGTFRAKEKITVRPQVVYDWSFAERARR